MYGTSGTVGEIECLSELRSQVAVSQAAVSKTDIFKFCFRGFFAY
jgi:hypothetical protein